MLLSWKMLCVKPSLCMPFLHNTFGCFPPHSKSSCNYPGNFNVLGVQSGPALLAHTKRQGSSPRPDGSWASTCSLSWAMPGVTSYTFSVQACVMDCQGWLCEAVHCNGFSGAKPGSCSQAGRVLIDMFIDLLAHFWWNRVRAGRGPNFEN